MDNVGTVLELTKDKGLAVLDVQTRRLFDPRGGIPLTVTLGDGTPVPYLSPSLLADLIARPHPRYPFFVVKRVEQQFIQAFIQANGLPANLEHRAGSAEHHYQAQASDRDVVRDVVWALAADEICGGRLEVAGVAAQRLDGFGECLRLVVGHADVGEHLVVQRDGGVLDR
jgi:hypothetical protein